MEWVETTGRTIAEALDAALDELGVDEEDVSTRCSRSPRAVSSAASAAARAASGPG